MEYKTLNRSQASEKLEYWLYHKDENLPISNAYANLREEFIKGYDNASALVEQKYEDDKRTKYLVDIYFGVFLYEYFKKQESFNLRLAADDDFWAYLSIMVVPDIVFKRWVSYNAEGAIENRGTLEERYYKTPARIWLKTIWWFIHIAWQGNGESTLNLLDKFNNDVYTSIMERTGRQGMYIDLYREILRFYGNLDVRILNAYKTRLSQGKTDNLLRAVMRLHTVKTMVVDPCLYSGGIESYVKNLFNEFINRIPPENLNFKN